MTVEELSPQEVIGAANDGAVFVDVREDYELDEVAYDLANLLHIPMGEIPNRLEEIPKDKVLIVGCRSGKRSMNVCMFLKMQGYDNIKNLDGGIIGWVESGAPTK